MKGRWSFLKKRTKKLLRIDIRVGQQIDQTLRSKRQKLFASFSRKRRPFFLAFFTVFAPGTALAEPSLLSLYTQHCSGCHGTTGHGVPSAGIPDLHDAGSYAGIPAGRAYLVQVPGLSQSRLDDATAARMLNYILARFSVVPPGFRPYTAAEVGVLRQDKASDAETRRKAILAALPNLLYQK
jgi:mono/diheme cytochrome c family protein